MASLTFVFSKNITTSSLVNLFEVINCQMNLKWSISELDKTNSTFNFTNFRCPLEYLNGLYTSFYLFNYHYPNYDLRLIFEHYEFEINTKNDISSFIEEQEILTELLFDDIHYFLVVEDQQNEKKNFLYLVNKYFKIRV